MFMILIVCRRIVDISDAGKIHEVKIYAGIQQKRRKSFEGLWNCCS